MWSVGCILYELAIGSPLFPARDENELLEYFIITIGQTPDHYGGNTNNFSNDFNNNEFSNEFIIINKEEMLPQIVQSNGMQKEGALVNDSLGGDQFNQSFGPENSYQQEQIISSSEHNISTNLNNKMVGSSAQDQSTQI